MAADLPTLLAPPSSPHRESRSRQATTGPAPTPVEETAVAAFQKGDAINKPPRQLRRLPPISGGGGRKKKQNGAAATDDAAGTNSAERAAKAWMRQALAKRVATRMLKRSTAPPRPPPEGAEGEGSGIAGGGRKVLSCCCARLPLGMRCALHQAAAPGRAWLMRAQQRRGSGDIGGECGEVAMAVASPRAYGWAFSEYARWRRHVWMPSRFYLEHVDEHALLEHCVALCSDMRVD